MKDKSKGYLLLSDTAIRAIGYLIMNRRKDDD